MIPEELKKFGDALVVSSAGWRFDITDKDYGVYTDEIASARVFMDGPGTWFSPCFVWFDRMKLEPKSAAADISQEQISLIQSRIRVALKALRV